jgi:hypothetical protein
MRHDETGQDWHSLNRDRDSSLKGRDIQFTGLGAMCDRSVEGEISWGGCQRDVVGGPEEVVP